MADTPNRTESIFAAAVALPIAEERATFLDQACAGDAELRNHVEALLRAHERAGHLLDRPIENGLEQTRGYVPSEQPGAVIAGRYKLLEAIGEGGMGTVWVAEQLQPVRRKVALKLIKAGMDSKSVLARFEAERQALAVMDHPNIAKVLDGGMTENGRPFFVMEYVKGVPITEYCDANRLGVPERLQLFAQVCSAVQHAHQKGIIHRDLKPSNILVAPYDDKPVPKVIDFGLAKAMHQSLTERTLHTAHETVLGTPLYMSPEQAQLNNLDVDTRSDIYSLGVLLYELLTGSTPLEKRRFKEAAWDEIKRLIREEEPPRPSTRLSSTDTLASLAAGRQIEPAKLTKMVRGELDWIVMKALEKDRSRRYETANGFASDIQRYLAGEPVLAAPPSARYRLRKLAQKHRTALATAGMLALLLMAGVAVSTWQAVRATQAEAAARDAEQEALKAQQAEAERAEGERLARLDALAQKASAEQAAAAEKSANEKAQKRLAQIQKANEILSSIFENLDPKEIARNERPLQAILAEKLDKAVAQLEGESIGDALVVAGMQVKFAASLLGLGEFSKAIVLLEKARATIQSKLGADHPETLTSMHYLAWAYHHVGKFDLALPLQKETLKLRKEKLGPDHLDTLTSMNNLAQIYHLAGKLDLALPLYEETLKIGKAKFGPEHSFSLAGMNNLAMAYKDVGKPDLALPVFEETLKLMKAKLGPEHPSTLICMNNLALVYWEVGKRDLAVPLFEETLKLVKAKLGPEHPQTLRVMNNLGMTYVVTGKLELALPLYVEVLKLTKAKLGPDHIDTLISMNNLAMAYRDLDKMDLALPLFKETLTLTKAKLGPEHSLTLSNMNNLAMTYRDLEKMDLALPLFEETLKLRKATLGIDHPDTLNSMNYLGMAYGDANQGEKAAASFKEFVAGHRKRSKADDVQFAVVLSQVALDLLRFRQHAAAEEFIRECLAIREKKMPDHWLTFSSQSMLGGALLGQKKYDDAEPLLLKGYEGMKQREQAIPPQGKRRLNEAVERLVQLYEVMDKKDDAAKWRQELDKIKPAQKSVEKQP